MPIKKIITAHDREMRLSWKGMLVVFFGALILLILFGHFGELALARPVLDSTAIITITIAMRWNLRRHVWFWVTMTLLAALHVLLILFVPWTTKWIPAIVIIPIGIADLYGMLWVLSVVGRFMEREQKAADSGPSSR